MASIKNRFNQEIKDKRVLVCAHCGTFGGGIIENTLAAFNLALAMGADIVEMDVIRSKDGEFYVFHDTEESRLLGFMNNIHSLEAKEIENLTYLNQYGFRTKQKIEKLETILLALRNRCLINLDRCYSRGEDFFLSVIELVYDLQMQDQIIFKAPPKPEILAMLKKLDKEILFLPIITNSNQVDLCETSGIDILGFELVFNQKNSPLIAEENFRAWKKKGYVLWGNTLSIDYTYPLAAGYDDELALTSSLDLAWGQLYDLGFSIIQSDWVYFIKKYLKTRMNKEE